MLCICDRTTLRLGGRRWSRLKPLAVAFAGAVLLLFTPSVYAAPLDFAVVTGNYDSSQDAFPDDATNNWLDTTQTNVSVIPVSIPSPTLISVPLSSDDVFVRNGGTATISSATNGTGAVSNLTFNVGAPRTLVTDDGTTIFQNEVGGNGTVNMTGGTLAGSGAIGLTMKLGGTGLAAAGSPVFAGTFNQSGGTVNMSVGSSSGSTSSTLVIGNGTFSNSPTSLYKMTGGILTMVYQAGGNRGINVRSGTFDMSSGTIKNTEADGTGNYDQGWMQVSTVAGNANGALLSAGHNVAYAKFSGNAIVDTHQGLRVTPNNRAEGYVTVSGNASLKMGNDLQLAANAGTAGSVDAAYGQMDMSGGYVQVGQYTALATTFDKKFIIGDAGRGVFNMTGGNVLVGDQLRLSNNAVSSAAMTMQDPAGGPTGVPFSVTARNVETRNASTTDTSLTSNVTINSDDARFIQTNIYNTGTNLLETGTFRIGSQGKSTFEIDKGDVRVGQVATLPSGTDTSPGTVDLANSVNSRATLILAGGKLTIGGNVTRTNTQVATTPVVNLTGGQLIIDPKSSSPTGMSWLLDFTGAGSEITTRPNALLQVNVGDNTHPGNFEMNGGSWDLDIGPGAGFLAAGSDRFFLGNTVTLGTGKLTSGTLNLNYLSGYVPAIGDSRTIVRALAGGSVTLGSVAINAPGGDQHWVASVNGLDIRLTYVPEPTSIGLTAVGLILGMFGMRRRS
jgi:hypothetical protein